jgi:transketolase
MIPLLMKSDGPVYLRLGVSEEPKGWPTPAYAAWRKLLEGEGPVLAGVGPLVGGMLPALQQMEKNLRPEVWLVTELPVSEVPAAFMESVRSRRLVVVEEHRAHGGFGQMLAHHLATAGVSLAAFTHKHALGYVSGLYGSQKFHRAECGLDPASIAAAVSMR